MAENFLARYKEEGSESDLSDEIDIKQASEIVNNGGKQIEDKSGNSINNVPISTLLDKYKKKDVPDPVPYTFDPKSILENVLNSDYNTKLAPLAPEKPKVELAQGDNASSKGKIASVPKFDYKLPSPPKDFEKSISMNKSANKQLEYFANPKTQVSPNFDIEPDEYYRSSAEYKASAAEFDKEYGCEYTSGGNETEQLNAELAVRMQKLSNLAKQLETADLDMILFRNKLIREISDVQNDLKEAYSNIIVLMNDRTNMKDQYCVMQMKLKKLMGIAKNYQDDIQAYFCKDSAI